MAISNDLKSISDLCQNESGYKLFSRSRFIIKENGDFSFVRDYFGWLPSFCRSAKVREENRAAFSFLATKFSGNEQLLKRYVSEKKGITSLDLRKIWIVLALDQGLGDANDYGLDHLNGLNHCWKTTAHIAKNFINLKGKTISSFSEWDSHFYSGKVDGSLLKEARAFREMKKEKISQISCLCENVTKKLSEAIQKAYQSENKHFYSFKRRIVILKNGSEEPQCIVKKDFTRWVPRLICLMFKKQIQEEKQTLQWFEEQFGKERILRISKFYNLSLYGRTLYQEDFHQLLIALSVVTEEDMGGNSEGWDYNQCRVSYKNKLPSLEEADLFMEDDAYEEKAIRKKLGRKMGVAAFVGRSILRNGIESASQITKQRQWDYKRSIAMFWSSSMPKTYIPKGTFFIEPKGCRVFSDIFSFYGGHACLFKARAKKNANDSKAWDDEVQFTGTVSKLISGWHTIYQDMLPGIGSMGFLKLVKNKNFQAFLESKKENKSLKISGYSLGGTYAQYLTIYLRKRDWNISSLLMVNAPRMPVPLKAGEDDLLKDIGICKLVAHAKDMTCLGGYSRYHAAKGKNRIYILSRRVSDQDTKLKPQFNEVFPEAKKKFWATFFYIMREMKNHFYERDWHHEAIKLSDRDGEWKEVTGGDRISLENKDDVKNIADYCFPVNPHETSWEKFRSVFVKIIVFIFSSTIGLIAQLGRELGVAFDDITHISYLTKHRKKILVV